MIINENQLDLWVRGNARDAQGVIVELVWRLVAASSPRPKERRFPLGDSIGQHGPDGVLEVSLSVDPFLPEGRSYWEIGTGLDAGSKATSDYKSLTADIPKEERMDSTFVFVTPLSGLRGWEGSWKEDAQLKWKQKRSEKSEWKDVRVIDGTKLIDWLHQFPSVELWLAQRIIGRSGDQVETLERHWNLIRSIGEPPPLTPQVFLVNREDACAKLKEVFDDKTVQLKLETHFPHHIVEFVSAYLASLDDETRADAIGRCLVISGIDAWNAITTRREKHFLVADASLDLVGEAGTRLIQKARRAGHSVIFSGPRGGIPDPASIPLPTPRIHQIKDALEKAGYSEERARALAQKSGGNLGSLLRCLQNLSLMPEWTEGSAAAELAIAAMLGSWDENLGSDRTVVESISGKAYGEWIETVREVALRPGTPLTQQDGKWRFGARYEGWYTLGPRMFDEHLDRIKAAAISVLGEKDPQFELPSDDRHAARIHGKSLNYSNQLRNGLAECLALLGSHPKALTSCTLGKARATAYITVRDLLARSDWKHWASLNNLLPLLAEAAPKEFLDAVDHALDYKPCPFDDVFAQEGSGFMGRNYMSGLLWALETLAWDENLLNHVVVCLGELAARDPGGNWTNRPINSLTTIFLPWLPQTCASIARRGSAVASLLTELPDIGWKLIMSLLPTSHTASSGSRRPAWRDTIPDEWEKGVSHGDYWKQVELYADMAIEAAKNDRKKLAELIDHFENLPPTAQEKLLTHLGSDSAIEMSEADKLAVWTELVDLITKHRKFSDADWAMESAQVDKLATLSERLAPTAPAFRHQRLFSEREFELYEGKGNYSEQHAKLQRRRQMAIEEIEAIGGVEAVLAFAGDVQSPFQVGIAYGVVANDDIDRIVLPRLLESEGKSPAQFPGGFVWSRFHSRGWSWVDGIDTSQWTTAQIGLLLSFLPFTPATWERSKCLLGANEREYWSRSSANPYDAEEGLEGSIDKLIEHGRPHAAIQCLSKLLNDKMPFDSVKAVRALLAALESPEPPQAMDAYNIGELFKALQSDQSVSADDLFRLEWAYLPLLAQERDASPKFLGQRLANDPGFFCEVIRLVFQSKKEERSAEVPPNGKKEIATNAYRLLSEWQIPPGCKEDETYDADAISRWLEAVKTECSNTGHLEIAMTMVGHVLIHVPADPSGLWIHRAAAEALNAKDAVEMRNGFATELLNSRGVYWVDPTGKSELRLAAKYRTKADAIDDAGYHRLATTLRKLADSYELEAERVSSREPFDD